MAEDSKDSVIMFVDLVGSTSLYERLGDAAAQKVVARCLNLARECVESHQGSVTAEIGDEIMVLFGHPADAAAAACDIHAHMLEANITGPNERRIAMRIGMHLGEVTDGSDMSEETAKIAHWATDNAKPEQSLGTAVVIERLPRIFQAVSRFVDDETWQFVSIEHMALHEIIWDVESVTAYSGEIPTMQSQRCAQITFSWNGQEAILREERPVISIGRGPENDLVVDHDMVSRQHLSAQFSRGRCTITDNSTNGTVVMPKCADTKLEIRRDSLTLRGSGQIVLGRPQDVPEQFALRYQSS